MKKIKVALVMPTHSDINSSLNNLVKTYSYLIREGKIELTLFTDKRNDLELKDITIKKIRGFDYGTVLEKILFLTGIPRYYYFGMEKYLKEYDVIVANNPEFYAYSYQAYKIAKKLEKKFVLRTSQTVDGFFLYRIIKGLINPLVKPAYLFAQWNIFSNPEAKERCLRLKLIDKNSNTIVSGHAVDTELFKPNKISQSIQENKKILLSVGGLYPLKGHHLIIKALKEVSNSIDNVELWIVGRGYYESELRKLSEELGISSQVKFLGAQSHAKLSNTYNQSSMLVLANLQEITPAVSEALACEKPVVVMECGGREFVIPDDTYGLVSKRNDVQDLAQKITQVLKNEKKSISMAKKGRERVLKMFSLKNVADKFYQAFTE